MRGSSILKTMAVGWGALLLGQGAQAQQYEAHGSAGGFNAREVVASENAYRLKNRLEAVLHKDVPPTRLLSLAMTPGRVDSHQLCGVAITGQGRYALFHVSDSRDPEGSLRLTPISGSLNGLAVAHNDVYAQCGGVGHAVFLIDDYRMLD